MKKKRRKPVKRVFMLARIPLKYLTIIPRATEIDIAK